MRQIVVVESCSCRMEFLVLFRNPKSKTEHSTVRLRLKTSTKNHPFRSATCATTTKNYSDIIKHPLSQSIAKFSTIPTKKIFPQGRLQKTVTGDEGLGVR